MDALLTGLKIAAEALAVVIALIKVGTALISLKNAMGERKIFHLKAMIDPHGLEQVGVHNQTENDISVANIQLVQERSWFQKALRVVTGLEIGELVVIAWKAADTKLPYRLQSHDQKYFDFNVDKQMYPPEEHGKLFSVPARIMISVAGHEKIIGLKKSKRYIRPATMPRP